MASEISVNGKKGAARAYMQIAAQLRSYIDKLDIGDGGRLPAERELVRVLGVSRPTLREALIVLELQDEIEIRVGSGIYVKTPRPTGQETSEVSEPPRPAELSLNLQPEDSTEEVYQMRYLLEPSVAAQAARFMPAAQVKKLKKALVDMMQAHQTNGPNAVRRMADADRTFHITLAESTDNNLVIQTVTYLFDHRNLPIANKIHTHFEDRESWREAIEEHRLIYEAIKSRDPLQAQATMQRHLSQTHMHLMKLID